MHLFVELFTLFSFLACVAEALRSRGATGAWFFFAALTMGVVRENCVIVRDYLYGYAPLTLMIGKAPLIGAIIWGFSIYAGIVWAERISGRGFDRTAPSGRFIGLVCLFLLSLAFFFEPFLKLIDMARWQAGTRSYLDVPLIALIGYPSMTALFLLVWGPLVGPSRPPARRAGVIVLAMTAISLLHVVALQGLKSMLGW